MRLHIDHLPENPSETILIDVSECSLCGGRHEKLPLMVLNPPIKGETRSFTCPDKVGPAINIHIATSGTR
jgi:hypothetical protein